MKKLIKMRAKRIIFIRLVTAILTAVVAACGFGPNYNKPPAADVDGSPVPVASGVERDIESMRTANFEFIFVFKRKDGEIMTADDKAYIKSVAKPEPNRFTLSDDEKSVVAGSFYKFEPKVIDILEKRFIVEDLSPVKTADTLSNNSNGNHANSR